MEQARPDSFLLVVFAPQAQVAALEPFWTPDSALLPVASSEVQADFVRAPTDRGHHHTVHAWRKSAPGAESFGELSQFGDGEFCAVQHVWTAESPMELRLPGKLPAPLLAAGQVIAAWNSDAVADVAQRWNLPQESQISEPLEIASGGKLYQVRHATLPDSLYILTAPPDSRMAVSTWFVADPTWAMPSFARAVINGYKAIRYTQLLQEAFAEQRSARNALSVHVLKLAQKYSNNTHPFDADDPELKKAYLLQNIFLLRRSGIPHDLVTLKLACDNLIEIGIPPAPITPEAPLGILARALLTLKSGAVEESYNRSAMDMVDTLRLYISDQQEHARLHETKRLADAAEEQKRLTEQRAAEAKAEAERQERTVRELAQKQERIVRELAQKQEAAAKAREEQQKSLGLLLTALATFLTTQFTVVSTFAEYKKTALWGPMLFGLPMVVAAGPIFVGRYTEGVKSRLVRFTIGGMALIVVWAFLQWLDYRSPVYRTVSNLAAGAVLGAIAFGLSCIEAARMNKKQTPAAQPMPPAPSDSVKPPPT